MNKEEVGVRLRKFIVEKFGKLSVGADRLGMLPQSLQKYLNGEHVPGGKLLSQLRELGCDTDWLLLRTDEPYPNGISDGDTNEYLKKKDKVILSQAEEIQLLREEIMRLKRLVDELEADTEERMKQVRLSQSKSKSVEDEKSDKTRQKKKSTRVT